MILDSPVSLVFIYSVEATPQNFKFFLWEIIFRWPFEI